MSGRLGQAPCGHAGRAVIGHYYECLTVGCNGTPADADRDRCRKCGSFDVKPFRSQGLPPDTVACGPCGAIHWPGLDNED